MAKKPSEKIAFFLTFFPVVFCVSWAICNLIGACSGGRGGGVGRPSSGEDLAEGDKSSYTIRI